MAYKMFSVGLVLAFAGMCLCQQQSTSSSQSQYPSTAVSQASFQTGSAAALQQPQTKLEDIERDNLAAAFGQKTQQPSSKPSSVAPSVPQQPQSQQSPQSYQAIPQQQYFVQPYQALPQQFYTQPYQTQQQYLAQPYQMAFDYAGVQYSVVAPNSYPGNQIYQQYYVPAVPQPSAVPEYVTKQSFPAAAAPAQAQQAYKQQQFVAAPAQAQQEYKQQHFTAAPAQAQQEYKQQFAATPAQAQQEYKQQQFNTLAQAQQQYKQVQQQYVVPSPAYQYVQQPAAPSSNGPADYSYSTRHPATTAVQFKALTSAVQPQYQYNALPQQYQQQQQQPQYYYTVAATEQPRVQQSAKSQFSSGVKSTTPTPLVKEQFAYKFESSPQQQQQPGAAYSTLRYSA
uniref:Uncharacterized protein n=1 Tax=Schizaphis graminum TaxID=13262 RepID=A0A2S2P1F9_SCHGA